MKFKTPIPILAIAGKYHCEIIGDNSIAATGINEILLLLILKNIFKNLLTPLLQLSF
jgi:hypothetical protein